MPRPKTPKLLRSGEVARHFGITPQMVHVYTTMGLIRERRRTRSGYRLYGPETLKRLKLIREMIRLRRYPLRELARIYAFKSLFHRPPS